MVNEGVGINLIASMIPTPKSTITGWKKQEAEIREIPAHMRAKKTAVHKTRSAGNHTITLGPLPRGLNSTLFWNSPVLYQQVQNQQQSWRLPTSFQSPRLDEGQGQWNPSIPPFFECTSLPQYPRREIPPRQPPTVVPNQHPAQYLSGPIEFPFQQQAREFIPTTEQTLGYWQPSPQFAFEAQQRTNPDQLMKHSTMNTEHVFYSDIENSILQISPDDPNTTVTQTLIQVDPIEPIIIDTDPFEEPPPSTKPENSVPGSVPVENKILESRTNTKKRPADSDFDNNSEKKRRESPRGDRDKDHEKENKTVQEEDLEIDTTGEKEALSDRTR